MVQLDLSINLQRSPDRKRRASRLVKLTLLITVLGVVVAIIATAHHW